MCYFFETFIGNGFIPIVWQLIVMAIIVGILYFGVKKVIELSNKIFMPALALVLVILAIYGMTLDGAAEGLAFLFVPDWSALTNPSLYLAAVGQSFFSLSLGMVIMVTYGGYLSKQTESRIPSKARIVVEIDHMSGMVVEL